MEYSPGQIVWYATTQFLANARWLNHTKHHSDHNVIKLEINRRKVGKFTSLYKLNNQQIKEEIKRGKNHLKTNENGNTQKLWDAAKKQFLEKFKAINAYFKKQKMSQINNLTLNLQRAKKNKLSLKLSLIHISEPTRLSW